MPDPKGPPPPTGAAAEQQMRRLTRRSFVTGAAAALAGLGGWRWLTTARPEEELPWPLRSRHALCNGTTPIVVPITPMVIGSQCEFQKSGSLADALETTPTTRRRSRSKVKTSWEPMVAKTR